MIYRIISCFIIVILYSQYSFAIPIGATSISSLNFGVLVQGDPGKVIPSGSSENAENASIDVTGDPNTAYNIILPSGSVVMTTGAGSSSETITISNFTSFPSAGANGSLNALGHQLVFIGAELSSLQMFQAPGVYTGSLVITVSN